MHSIRMRLNIKAIKANKNTTLNALKLKNTAK